MDLTVGLRNFIEQGTPEAGKGYPLEVPQDAAMPAFAYQVLNDDATIAHSGRTVMSKATVLVTIVASSYQAAKSVQLALKGRLDGFKGSLGGVEAFFCKTAINDDWADIHQLPVIKFDVTIVYKP